MTTNKILDSIFKDFLDGKTAQVKSEGLMITGAPDGLVSLKYDKDLGLGCLGKLKDNTIDLMKDFTSNFTTQREHLKFSYESNERILSLIKDILSQTCVQYGIISSTGVRHFETSVDEQGEISLLSIIYDSGSKTYIHIAPS